jgi:putative transposase
LDISRSGYYAWLSRPLCKTKQENIQLTEQISKVFEQSRGVYGAPRVTAALNSDGQVCGKNRVTKLMRIAQFKGRPKRVFRRTAQSNPYAKPAPNLLHQNFVSKAVNQVWSSDITYI